MKRIAIMLILISLPKGRFTRYDFVAYDKLTTGLRHELFLVNQTYNLLTIDCLVCPTSCCIPVVFVPCKSAFRERN